MSTPHQQGYIPTNRLIQNAVYVPEHLKYYVSSHQHDFVPIDFKDGLEYYLDGGLEYQRAGGNLTALYDSKRVVKLHLYSQDDFTTKIVPNLLWGTRGVKGNQPLEYRPMSSFDTDHLRNILANCPNASNMHRLVAHHIIHLRTK